MLSLPPDQVRRELERDLEPLTRLSGAAGGWVCGPAQLVRAGSSDDNVRTFVHGA